eukprot:718865-Alexandrium_andersonii.AAC.1
MGQGPEFEKACAYLRKHLDIKIEQWADQDGGMRYLGRILRQAADGSVEIDMKDYLQNLRQLH